MYIICIYVYICMYMYMCIYEYVCICVYVYICMCMYMYIYMYMFIYIYIKSQNTFFKFRSVAYTAYCACRNVGPADKCVKNKSFCKKKMVLLSKRK